MAKRPDPNIEVEEFNAELDPFAEGAGVEEGTPGLEGAGDPFDFNPNPGSPPPKAPQPSGGFGAPPAAPAAGGKVDRRGAGLTADVPVQLVAVLGKKAISIKEILSLKKGQVLELNRFPNEAVDLVANGKLMAKGELVEIDGKLGVRIIKIFE
ncbi:MAG TPA: FliM/FliN family flagellar motor switch protein [bacterium]|nr:FliM/FliN family flagellar motor switch protein [bacterium]